jgi:hypothetical protein
MQNLGNPLRGVSDAFPRRTGDVLSYLLLDVVKGVGRVNGKANQDNVGVGVGKRAQTVVIFLTCGIPESELDVFAVDLDIGDVVLEDSGNIDLVRT